MSNIEQMDVKRETKLDDFLLALIYLADERHRENPRVEVIESWYKRAQMLFTEAISEAVKLELEAIELEVIIKEKSVNAQDFSLD